MIGIDFSDRSLTYLWSLFLVLGPYGAGVMGPHSWKSTFLAKSKTATRAHIVHQRKKLRKQKSLLSMSYNWSGKTLVTGGIQRIHIPSLLCFGCPNCFMECERRENLTELLFMFEKIWKYYCKTVVLGGIYGYIYIYCYVFDV